MSMMILPHRIKVLPVGQPKALRPAGLEARKLGSWEAGKVRSWETGKVRGWETE